MEIKNICYPEKYNKDGEEKTKWHNVGVLFIKDDGKMSIKMNLLPVNFDGNLMVFDRENNNQQNNQGQQQNNQQYQQPQPQPQVQYQNNQGGQMSQQEFNTQQRQKQNYNRPSNVQEEVIF